MYGVGDAAGGDPAVIVGCGCSYEGLIYGGWEYELESCGVAGGVERAGYLEETAHGYRIRIRDRDGTRVAGARGRCSCRDCFCSFEVLDEIDQVQDLVVGECEGLADAGGYSSLGRVHVAGYFQGSAGCEAEQGAVAVDCLADGLCWIGAYLVASELSGRRCQDWILIE